MILKTLTPVQWCRLDSICTAGSGLPSEFVVSVRTQGLSHRPGILGCLGPRRRRLDGLSTLDQTLSGWRRRLPHTALRLGWHLVSPEDKARLCTATKCETGKTTCRSWVPGCLTLLSPFRPTLPPCHSQTHAHTHAHTHNIHPPTSTHPPIQPPTRTYLLGRPNRSSERSPQQDCEGPIVMPPCKYVAPPKYVVPLLLIAKQRGGGLTRTQPPPPEVAWHIECCGASRGSIRHSNAPGPTHTSPTSRPTTAALRVVLSTRRAEQW